jgi:hypothetical protein
MAKSDSIGAGKNFFSPLTVNTLFFFRFLCGGVSSTGGGSMLVLVIC